MKIDAMGTRTLEKDAQKPLTPAMENYLEAIYNLDSEKRVVRVKDIAKRLGVKMPTVTNMLKTLHDRGLINYERYEYLELTKDGADVGEEIDRRHHILRDFLTDILGIDFDKADEEACSMEHAIGATTMDRLVAFMEFIQSCPRTGDNWLEHFEEFRTCGHNQAKCLKHMKAFADEFEDRMKDIETGEKDDDGSQQG
ncbi:MAG: DtxR family transcriptional regulator, Mn-dependent transcriptional regulator [Thermodesulfobacteriota bacterium]|nr:DtxR family transcriptional regulator, Mn-dependent transcriptional regulator [Thermodesulfobacteriota bacterium]